MRYRITYDKAIEADETEHPICPYCDFVLAEVEYRIYSLSDALMANQKGIFFCPNCKKVLGVD